MSEKSVHVRLKSETMNTIKALAMAAGVDVGRYVRRIVEECVHGRAYHVGMAVASLDAPNVTTKKNHVYLIKCGSLYKIGRSVSPEKRIRGMQLPLAAKVIATFETTDAAALEKRLHRAYKAKRKRGEWFALTPDDVTAIMGAQAEGK